MQPRLPHLAHFDSVLEIIAQRRAASPEPVDTPKSSRRDGDNKKLNAFNGVFVPTLQNILGVILFLRVTLITGYAGIGSALGIVWMSCIATLLTSISMSAVATNGVPRAGGAYAMIKNSLGAQFAGVTGLLLFLANVFAGAMYVLGAVEVLRTSYASIFQQVNERLLGACILTGLALIVLIGIKYISKFAVLFLSGVAAALLSIWIGVLYRAITDDDKSNSGVSGFSVGNLRDNWGPRYCDDWDWPSLLGLFFPSTTDPLAGSNLSGDLRDPQAAIPIGTIAAVLVSMVVFTLQVIIVAGASGNRGHCGASDGGLRGDAGGAFVIAIGWPLPFIVEIGILVSTLGAGLQSLAGAPRLLSALAADHLFPILDYFAPQIDDSIPPEPFSPTKSRRSHRAPDKPEPRKAVLLCASLTCCCVMINSLDQVAPAITLFFLTCYTIINAAAAFNAYERAPNFRPTFHYFDWRVSVLGSLLCVFIMFIIAPLYATAVFVLSYAIYKYIETQPGAALITASYDTELAQLAHTDKGTIDSSPDASTSSLRFKNFWTRRRSKPISTPGEADWRASLRFRQARKAMLSLTEGDLEFKYWRPFVLFLCKLDHESQNYYPQGGMINLIAQLMHAGRGIALVSGVLVSKENRISSELVHTANYARRKLTHTLQERKVEGFADVIIAPSVLDGNRLLIQSKGMGVFRPNAVALGWPSSSGNSNSRDDANKFYQLISDAHIFGKTVLVCKGASEFPADADAFDHNTRIDVWWIFDLFPANGLLLLIPYLLQKSKTWKGSKLRLIVVSENAEEDIDLDNTVRDMLKAGGLIADLLLLHVSISDAPRYAHGRKKSPLNQEALETTQITFVDDPNFRTSSDGDEINQNSQNIPNETIVAIPPRLNHQSSRVPSKLDWDEYTQPSKLVTLVNDYSATAELVVMPLPVRVPGQTAHNWMISVDTLVASLRRVIFVKETGHENIQFFN